MNDPQRTRTGVPPWSMAVAAMLLIQVSNALSVTVIDYVGPGGTAWLRMCFGAVFLLLIVRPSIRSIRVRDLPMLFALGAVTGFMTTFFLAAVDRIPLGTAVAIEFLGPLTVAGLASKRKSALAWPALALLGVVLLTEPWHGGVDLIGVGYAVLAGACWGTYNVFTQLVGDRYSRRTAPGDRRRCAVVDPASCSRDRAHHARRLVRTGDARAAADDAHRVRNAALPRTRLRHRRGTAPAEPVPHADAVRRHRGRGDRRGRSTARWHPGATRKGAALTEKPRYGSTFIFETGED